MKNNFQSNGKGRYQRVWQLLISMLIILTMGIGQMWGANGDVLFSQSFDETGAGTVAYTVNTARAYTTAEGKTLAKVVETGKNYFTSITCNAKNSFGIGINTTSGYNSENWTGMFGVFSDATSEYWSMIRTADFATTAPTAIKVEMNATFSIVSGGSNIGVQFAVGDEFEDGLTNSCPPLNKCVAGFALPSNNTIRVSKYAVSNGITHINSSSTTLTNGTKYKYTWVINNTNETLTYKGPDNNNTTVAAGCWDLWIGTTRNLAGISQSTTGMSGTAIQNIYIGSPFGKKHKLVLEDIAITDLTPAATTYTVTYQSGAGTGDDVVDDAATIVAGCPNTFTAPLGKVFAGWKNGDDDVAVGATVSATMTLVAQWADPTTPTITFDDSDYSIGGTLDLSTLFESNSSGAVTYTIKSDDDNTGAAIDGNNFTATSVGTVVVTASQAASGIYAAGSEDATITVLCTCAITTQPANKSISQAQANPTLSIEATDALSYAWYASSDGTSYDGSVVLGTEATYTPTVHEVVGTTYYYCDVTSACDGTTIVQSNIATVTVTAVAGLAELVTITKDYTFTPTATVAVDAFVLDGTDKVLLNIGGNECNYNDGSGIRIKENRALAFKVADGARVKVTFTKNGSRAMKLGTALTGAESSAYGTSSTSPVTFDVTTGRVVYLTTTSDLYMSELKITYARSVTYDLNGGDGTVPTEGTHFAGEHFTLHNGTTNITAPSSKEFNKWKDQDDNEFDGGAEYTMPSKAVTLTAQWRAATTKYAVTYSLNGAPGDAPTSPDKAEGDEVTLASAPSWTGYRFDGWTVAETVSGDPVAVSEGKFTMPAAAVTVTAQWTLLETKIYSLTGAIGSAEVTAADATVSAEALVMSNTNGRIKLTPATGETFKSGDVVTISGTIGTGSSKDFGVKVFAANGSTKIADVYVANSVYPRIATATLSADAEYIYIGRYDGTGTTLLTCEITRSWAVGATSGLAYATAEVEKLTTDAAFTNPLTNTNNLVIAGYTSSDETVATIGANGQVTIVGAGTTTITAKSAIQTKSGTLYAAGTASYTLTVSTPPTYAVTYAKGDEGADGTMTDSNSPYVEGTEVTLLANTFTAPSGKEFDEWVVTKTASGDPVSVTAGKFSMPGEAVTVTATWKDITTKYDVTEGTHTNGSITIDPVKQEAGKTVTLTATPDEDYVFSAWDVYKTGETETKVSVTSNAFTMPAYGVTVNATFAADPRQKVLYVTSNSEADTKSDDKVYAALKDIYNVKIAGPTSDADQSTFALVVLHESVGGGNHNATAVAAAKVGTTPVLNTKAYFYNNANTTNQRWNWGTPSAGKKTKGVHVNRAYCNITDHPLFTDLTPDANDSIIILSSINSDNKPIQPITAFTTGKEGYTLAIVPDGCAIHELTPAQRGASSGKYLLISLYSKDFANLNANGQKLFQNAAAYLIGSTSWDPIAVPTAATVTATPTSAYAAGDDISLTASATGTIDGTTYTWYKGATLEAAIEAGAIKATATAAAGGNTFAKAACVAGDAGIYWCVISNGTDCDASASLEVTVSAASNITFVSAHGTAPSATTGASYTLPELTESGWVHQGWTASIDVTVDEAVVTIGTRIANGKVASFGADVEFTAVWAQEFQVSFNLKGYGTPIAPQDIVDGGKVTKPSPDPSESGYEFGGWYKESACTNAWDFDNDVVTEDTELYAKWTADPCPSPFSLSKVVLTSTSEGTVTGYNSDEFAGTAVIGGLSGSTDAEVDASHEGQETGYKLNNGGSAIVFATLKKGTFQVGDRVVVTITKKQDAYKVEEVAQPILDIYYGDSKDDATLLTTINGVTAAGSYTYRLTAADVTAIGTKKGIGVFRPSSGRTQNPYVYSVEIKGCREWAIFHTLTFKNIDGTATIAAESLEEGAYASTVAPAAPKIAMKRFLGWAEAIDGTPVELTSYTITEDKILYAVYEDIVCPTNGTVYKFEIKDELPSENLPTSTDKDMSSYITATGDGYLTYTATANNKATINSDGTIQLKDATAAYLKLELACALADGDQIRAHVSNNPIRVQVGTIYDSNKDIILAKDNYVFVDITSDMVGKQVLYITRSTNGNANIADFEIYRRPALTGVTMDDMRLKIGKTGTPVLHLLPADDAIVTSQAWEIVGTPVEGASINETTGLISAGTATGEMTVKVTLNGDKEATATVTIVQGFEAPVPVSATTVWNWSTLSIPSGDGPTISAPDTVLANYLSGAGWENLAGNAGGRPYRSSTYQAYQGTSLYFKTTVPGILTINGTYTSSNKKVYVNGIEVGTVTGSRADLSKIVVPAGDVYITSDAMRIYWMKFDTDLAACGLSDNLLGGYTRTVAAGQYGTICLATDGVMTGGILFEIAYYDSETRKIFFDEVLNGEMIADRPYVFLPEENSTQLKVFYTEEENAEVTAGHYNGLWGTYVDLNSSNTTESPLWHNYIISNNMYIRVTGSNCTLRKNRAYIKFGTGEVPESPTALLPGRRRISLGTNSTEVATDIDNVQGDNVQCTKVMIDGQLYILRGEKMYDATGRMVK